MRSEAHRTTHTRPAAGIELLAPVDRSHIAEVIAGADVVIGQQRLRALGLSELEAMSCARPVVMPVRTELYPAELPVLDRSGPPRSRNGPSILLDDPARRRSHRSGGSPLRGGVPCTGTGCRDDRRRVRDGAPPVIPRCTTGAVGLALASHLVATVVALRTPAWIPAWQWALLAFVDAAVIVASWTVPDAFTLRNFRLPGVFMTSFAVVILLPLPATLRRFGDQIPLAVVPAIAIGMAALMFVVVIGTVAFRRAPAPNHFPDDRAEALLPLAIVGLSIAVFPVWLRSLPSVPILACGCEAPRSSTPRCP